VLWQILSLRLAISSLQAGSWGQFVIDRALRLKYMLDLQILTFIGAMEVEFDSLLRRAGFRILKIHKS